VLPCLLFEDDHLLVINKPAGINTHAPAPHAGEGIYDWLHHREPRWADLAIIHRLDKETSGVLVFSKTRTANQSLTAQFAGREVRKKYQLITDRPLPGLPVLRKTALVRAGERYLSRPVHAGADIAETRFRVLDTPPDVRTFFGAAGSLVEAEPLTGRTHQIRVHAADLGFPILGDTLYGGTPADRAWLHAAEITFQHPGTGQEARFKAPFPAMGNARLAMRELMIDPELTNAMRLVQGAADGWPGLYVDRLGEWLLAQSEQELTARQLALLEHLVGRLKGVYHKGLSRHVRKTAPADVSPRLVVGEAAPETFCIRENGLNFKLSFREGYSVGLFLDQRDNRRRCLTGHVAAGFELYSTPVAADVRRLHSPANAGNPADDLSLPASAVTLPGTGAEVLNTFAYTCGFSVCAAKAGARVTSLDLSRKYLDWGKDNFLANDLDPAAHDFIFGDTFDWLKRFSKKRRRFDVILLDPPTFSQSKASGVFRVERDFARLVAAAAEVLAPNGVILASSNAAEWSPEDFLEAVHDGIKFSGKKPVGTLHYVPQPLDFPITRTEPAYLKTVWVRCG